MKNVTLIIAFIMLTLIINAQNTGSYTEEFDRIFQNVDRADAAIVNNTFIFTLQFLRKNKSIKISPEFNPCKFNRNNKHCFSYINDGRRCF